MQDVVEKKSLEDMPILGVKLYIKKYPKTKIENLRDKDKPDLKIIEEILR